MGGGGGQKVEPCPIPEAPMAAARVPAMRTGRPGRFQTQLTPSKLL